MLIGEYYTKTFGYYFDHLLRAWVSVDGRSPLGKIEPSPIGAVDRHP